MEARPGVISLTHFLTTFVLKGFGGTEVKSRLDFGLVTADLDARDAWTESTEEQEAWMEQVKEAGWEFESFGAPFSRRSFSRRDDCECQGQKTSATSPRSAARRLQHRVPRCCP